MGREMPLRKGDFGDRFDQGPQRPLGDHPAPSPEASSDRDGTLDSAV